MTPDYTIVRVHAQLGLDALVTAVKEWQRVGWTVEGAPFRDENGQSWCQAMWKQSAVPNGQVRLREPKR